MQVQNDRVTFLATFLSLPGTMVAVVLFIANRNRSFAPGILAFIIMSDTQDAMEQQVGFQSGTVFIAAVKKRTGKTPSEFFGKKRLDKRGVLK